MPYPHVTQLGSLGPAARLAAADAHTRRATRPCRSAEPSTVVLIRGPSVGLPGPLRGPAFRDLRDA